MNENTAFSHPLINEEEVMKVLNSFIYWAGKRINSDLERLILIDRFLDSIHWQPNARSRHYGLERVLIQSISEHFTYVAGLLRLEVDSKENYEQAILSIADVGKIDNPELIGWAWLYYRFVRLELCISVPVFSASCCINERTLRRYQSHAVSRLTDLLVAQESQARLTVGV